MKKNCGHLRNRFSLWTALVAAGLLALLAGCGGGGGGGGGSSSGPSTEVFSGTVTDTASSSGAAGFTVRFDSSGPTTTTTSSGTFSFSIPQSDITGSDTIYVLDSNGFVVGSTSVTNDSAGSSGILVNVGPPPAPPLAIHA